MSGKKTVVCEECGGTGIIEDDECPFCLGEGNVEVDEDETWEASEDLAEVDEEYDDLFEEMDDGTDDRY
jgi:DnaJ-class molecular chaperone